MYIKQNKTIQLELRKNIKNIQYIMNMSKLPSMPTRSCTGVGCKMHTALLQEYCNRIIDQQSDEYA